MIHCAQCGIQKREVNHWFLLWTERGGMRLCVVPFDFDPQLAREEGVQTLCGTDCLHKAVHGQVDMMRITA